MIFIDGRWVRSDNLAMPGTKSATTRSLNDSVAVERAVTEQMCFVTPQLLTPAERKARDVWE